MLFYLLKCSFEWWWFSFVNELWIFWLSSSRIARSSWQRKITCKKIACFRWNRKQCSFHFACKRQWPSHDGWRNDASTTNQKKKTTQFSVCHFFFHGNESVRTHTGRSKYAKRMWMHHAVDYFEIAENFCCCCAGADTGYVCTWAKQRQRRWCISPHAVYSHTK